MCVTDRHVIIMTLAVKVALNPNMINQSIMKFSASQTTILYHNSDPCPTDRHSMTLAVAMIYP